jgi:membrane protease YdiL (CAAX protease family)
VSKLRDTVQAWSVRTEALIVLVGAFGLTLLSTVAYLASDQPAAAITETELQSLLIYESATFLLLGGFLHLRGWTFRRVGLAARLIDPLIGVGLAMGIYLIFESLWMLATAAHLKPTYLNGETSVVAGQFALFTVIAASAVNALFEEVFVCGYLISVAKENGHLAVGVNASIALRLAYHLYEGGAGVIMIIPVGLIFALWFSRTGRLWPVVVAHTLIDVAALFSFIK